MTSAALLVDTGPLVALRLRTDSQHEPCKHVLATHHGHLLTTWPVLTETCYLLRRRPAAVLHLVDELRQGTWLRVAELDRDHFASWLKTFFKRFDDREPQLADASLVYLAETHELDAVFTLDKRDFRV